MNNININDTVRSFDFDGKRDYFVEGVVKAIVKVGQNHRGNMFPDCDRYAIKVSARVLGGERTEHEGALSDVWAYPPVNGTKTYMGGAVTNGVELLLPPTLAELRRDYESLIETSTAPFGELRATEVQVTEAARVVNELDAKMKEAKKVYDGVERERNKLRDACRKDMRSRVKMLEAVAQAHVEQELLGKDVTCAWYDDEKFTVVKVWTSLVAEHVNWRGNTERRALNSHEDPCDVTVLGYALTRLEVALKKKDGSAGKRTYLVEVTRTRYGAEQFKRHSLQWDGAGSLYRKFDIVGVDLPDYWTAAGVPVIIPEEKESA